MQLAKKISSLIRNRVDPVVPEIKVEEAYDKWASTYDQQPDNLILALDAAIFQEYASHVLLTDTHIVDVGCGTGRHWSFLLGKEPGSITGYDASGEMLHQLKQKFPGAKVFHQQNHLLKESAGSVDLLFSTLTLAHLPEIEMYMTEWCRVLQPGGTMILTDYHPDALANGARRTFASAGKRYAVESRVYPVWTIVDIALQNGLNLIDRIERKIDESMLSWYRKQNAAHVYHKYKGTPIIYGLWLQKKI